MTFTPVYSKLTTRLREQDNGGWEVHDRALQMQRAGEDVILLCVGDPDFRTPEPIIDNAVSYLRVGRTHYSPSLGEIKFRRAVADLETLGTLPQVNSITTYVVMESRKDERA